MKVVYTEKGLQFAQNLLIDKQKETNQQINQAYQLQNTQENTANQTQSSFYNQYQNKQKYCSAKPKFLQKVVKIQQIPLEDYDVQVNHKNYEYLKSITPKQIIKPSEILQQKKLSISQSLKFFKPNSKNQQQVNRPNSKLEEKRYINPHYNQSVQVSFRNDNSVMKQRPGTQQRSVQHNRNQYNSVNDIQKTQNLEKEDLDISYESVSSVFQPTYTSQIIRKQLEFLIKKPKLQKSLNKYINHRPDSLRNSMLLKGSIGSMNSTFQKTQSQSSLFNTTYQSSNQKNKSSTQNFKSIMQSKQSISNNNKTEGKSLSESTQPAVNSLIKTLLTQQNQKQLDEQQNRLEFEKKYYINSSNLSNRQLSQYVGHMKHINECDIQQIDSNKQAYIEKINLKKKLLKEQFLNQQAKIEEKLQYKNSKLQEIVTSKGDFSKVMEEQTDLMNYFSEQSQNIQERYKNRIKKNHREHEKDWQEVYVPGQKNNFISLKNKSTDFKSAIRKIQDVGRKYGRLRAGLGHGIPYKA